MYKEFYVDEDGALCNEDGIPYGNNIGILLPIKKEGVRPGQVLAFPGSATPHKHFEALIYVLKKDEDGLEESLFEGKVSFYINHGWIKGSVKTPKIISPGESGHLEIELESPVFIEKGRRFLICNEGEISTKRRAIGIVTQTGNLDDEKVSSVV